MQWVMCPSQARFGLDGELFGPAFEHLRGHTRVVDGEAPHRIVERAEWAWHSVSFEVREPMTHAVRGLLGGRGGWTKPFDEDESLDPLGARSSVEAGDGASHRVPDEHESRESTCSNKGVDVGDVVRKVVVAADSDARASPEAPEVRRDDFVSVRREWCGHVIPGGSAVEKPMETEERHAAWFCGDVAEPMKLKRESTAAVNLFQSVLHFSGPGDCARGGLRR